MLEWIAPDLRTEARIEMKYKDGTPFSIDYIAVESKVARNMYERS